MAGPPIPGQGRSWSAWQSPGAGQRFDTMSDSTTEPVAITNCFSISPQQGYLWRLRAGETAYRARCSFLARGDLSHNSLHDAPRDIAARHEILRTRFRHLPGMKLPVQHVLA